METQKVTHSLKETRKARLRVKQTGSHLPMDSRLPTDSRWERLRVRQTETHSATRWLKERHLPMDSHSA